MNYFGMFQRIINLLDPFLLKKCPLIDYFGTKNMTIDSSVLEPYPVWLYPSRHAKLCLGGKF